MAARPRPNFVEYGNSKTTTLLPSAKCTRPLFQDRTGCGGRPSGWHDIVTCQRLVITSYFGFKFTSAYNSILFCCLRRNVEPCCHTHDSRPLHRDCVRGETALGRSRTVYSSASIALGRKVQQLLLARPDNQWFRNFSLPTCSRRPR